MERQTTLDEFSRIREDNRDQLRRVRETHISRMEQIFNELFSKLFNGEQYICKVERNVED